MLLKYRVNGEPAISEFIDVARDTEDSSIVRCISSDDNIYNLLIRNLGISAYEHLIDELYTNGKADISSLEVELEENEAENRGSKSILSPIFPIISHATTSRPFIPHK